MNRPSFLLALLVAAFTSTSVIADGWEGDDHLRLTSTTFVDHAAQLPLSMIGTSPPNQNSCTSTGMEGGNQSPQLSWTGVPPGTRSFVVILYDVVASFTHWGMYNISGKTTILLEGAGVAGSLDGSQVYNDFGDPFYDGPCPPIAFTPQSHHYVVTLYALDKKIVLPTFGDFTPFPEALYHALLRASLEGHILDTASIDGFYSAAIPPGP